MDLDDNLTVEERNLKIAAQIGQSLLEQNNCLKLHAEELEAELSAANETITQLRHEISTKNQLIQLYSADLEITETEIDSIDETSCSSSRDTKQHSQQNNWDLLQEQITFLENENLKLRSEASRRTMDIEAEEKKEFLLIHDCAKQLIEANLQLINLQEELARRAEDNVHQHEEITNLLSQVVELKKKIRDLSQENEGLYNALDLAHECQNVLSAELLEVKEKYNVLMSAFQELQEEMKRKSDLSLSNWPPAGSYMPFGESLAAELDDSLDSFGYESGLSSLNRITRKETDESRCHSPDSVLGGSGEYGKGKIRGKLGSQANSFLLGRAFGFSNKLKFVKSLDNSEVLTRWQKLATPHMDSIFENPSGVHNRIIANIRTDLSNHVTKTAGVTVCSVTVTSMSLSNQSTNITTTCNNNNNYRIRLSNNNETDGHLQDNNFEKDGKSNPGKIFDTTLSTYTYTTTSLSLTSESTLVTPSFSAVQLSTGHIIPISSVSTTSISSDSFDGFSSSSTSSLQPANRYTKNSENNLTVNDSPSSSSSSPSSSTTTKTTSSSKITASNNDLATTSTSSSTSNISNYPRIVSSSTSSISVLFQDLLRNKCSNYVKYLSGALAAMELSSNDIISYRDLNHASIACSLSHKGSVNSPSSYSSTTSPKSSSQHSNGLNYLTETNGLDKFSSMSLLSESCDRGVITKGSTLNPASIGDPKKDGSKEKSSTIELHRIVYSGKLLPLKTLRKGGFV